MARKDILSVAPPPTDASEDKHFENIHKMETERKVAEKIAAVKRRTEQEERNLEEVRRYLKLLDRTHPEVELGQFSSLSKRGQITLACIVGATLASIVASYWFA